MAKRLVVALATLALALIGTSPVQAAAPRVVSAPSINAYATVGTTVKLVAAKFSAAGKVVTSWLYNGKPIAGATAASYKITAKQSSGTLQAKQVASISGKSLTAVSNTIHIGKLVVLGTPSIAYTDGTSSTLKVVPATVLPAPASITYKWLRDGFDIPSETADTHLVATSDKGELVSLRITLTAPKGYTDQTITTSELRVPAMARSYQQVWSDEFNGAAGSAPDSSIWTAQNGDGVAYHNKGWGNNEREWYSADQSQQDGNGSLVVTATRTGAADQHCYYGACEWLSSKYVTKGKVGFKYGRIEARIKGAPGLGTWNAFWSLGADDSTNIWPSCGEIDFTELVGKSPSDVLGYSHGLVSWGAGRGNTTTLTSPWSDDYHTYAVDWLPDQLTWYVDGVPYGVVDKTDLDWRYDHEFYLIFNLAMGGNLGGTIDPGLNQTQMKIDWVRFSKINGVGEVITH
jgi:beta-glucanase (GH16 family)